MRETEKKWKERGNYLQFSMVLGSDPMRLPEMLRILSFDKHPIEFGRAFSWFECTSSTITFSNLAANDSGIT